MIKISDLLARRVGARNVAVKLNKDAFQEKFARLVKHFPPIVISDRLAGVEIELENSGQSRRMTAAQMAKANAAWHKAFPDAWADHFPEPFWHVENDGSLRNNGVEYVSHPGATFTNMTSMLLYIRTWLDIFEPQIEANARTGLHVHVDVRDWTLNDLQRFLMLYLVVEKTLFNFSGGREESLFCVPLAETDLHLNLLKRIKTVEELNTFLASVTKKYMGLNLKPILSQGTIEFRMHLGTKDPHTIISWLEVINAIMEAPFRWPEFQKLSTLESTIFNLQKSRGNIHGFIERVFGATAPRMWMHVNFDQIIAGVELVKEAQIPLELLSAETLTREDAAILYTIENSSRPLARRFMPEDEFLIRPAREALERVFLGRRPHPLNPDVLNDAIAIRDIAAAGYEVAENFLDEDGVDLPGNIPNGNRWYINNARNYVHISSLVLLYYRRDRIVTKAHATMFDYQNDNQVLIKIIKHGHSEGHQWWIGAARDLFGYLQDRFDAAAHFARIDAAFDNLVNEREPRPLRAAGGAAVQVDADAVRRIQDRAVRMANINNEVDENLVAALGRRRAQELAALDAGGVFVDGRIANRPERNR